MNQFPQPGQANFQQFAGQEPAPAAAPAPQQFGPPPGAAPQQFQQPMAAPAQNYGPGYGAASPNPMGAPGAAFGPGAFDGASLQGHQDPTPKAGIYVLECVDTVLKTQNGRTHVTTLKVIDNGNNPAASPIDAIVGNPQKLDGSQWAFKYGTGAILAMTMAMTGFSDEGAFKTQIPAWSPLLNAMCDNKQPLPGNPWPANPLKGRRARCEVTFSGSYTKKNNKPIMNFTWSVLA